MVVRNENKFLTLKRERKHLILIIEHILYSGKHWQNKIFFLPQIHGFFSIYLPLLGHLPNFSLPNSVNSNVLSHHPPMFSTIQYASLLRIYLVIKLPLAVASTSNSFWSCSNLMSLLLSCAHVHIPLNAITQHTSNTLTSCCIDFCSSCSFSSKASFSDNANLYCDEF